MKKISGALGSKKGNNILNAIIYTLFFAIVSILGYKCYTLNIEANKVPETVWKEYNTVTYVEVPVTKTVTKTVYKTKEVSKNTKNNTNKEREVEYSKDENGVLIVDIK